MDPYEQFIEVYSISDLHLTIGDNVDGQALAALDKTVTQLTARTKLQKKQRTALVVNGDIVDLTERGATRAVRARAVRSPPLRVVSTFVCIELRAEVPDHHFKAL